MYAIFNEYRTCSMSGAPPHDAPPHFALPVGRDDADLMKGLQEVQI